jgi:hypothetical protein
MLGPKNFFIVQNLPQAPAEIVLKPPESSETSPFLQNIEPMVAPDIFAPTAELQTKEFLKSIVSYDAVAKEIKFDSIDSRNDFANHISRLRGGLGTFRFTGDESMILNVGELPNDEVLNNVIAGLNSKTPFDRENL